MTESYRAMADQRLGKLTVTPALKAEMMGRIAQAKTSAVRRKPMTLLLAALALVFISLGAFALTRGFGLFDWMAKQRDPGYEKALPEARELVSHNLAFHRFAHVDVTINEAVYDGRFLRVMYTTRDRAAKAPFPVDEEGYLIEGESGLEFPAASADDVFYSVDWCLVNGKAVSVAGEAQYFAGENPGEIVAVTPFDLSGMDVGDSLRALLPVKGEETPEDMAFTLSTTSLPGVSRLKLPTSIRMNDHCVSVSSFVISPIRVYAALDIQVDPGVSLERCEQITYRWMDTEIEGLVAALNTAGIRDPDAWDQNLVTQAHADLSYMPSDHYPDVFVLSSLEGRIPVPNQPAP